MGQILVTNQRREIEDREELLERQVADLQSELNHKNEEMEKRRYELAAQKLRIDDLWDRLTATIEQNKENEQQISDLKTDKANLEKRLEESGKRVTSLDNQLQSNEQSRKGVKELITQLQEQLKNSKDENKTSQEKLRKRLAVKGKENNDLIEQVNELKKQSEKMENYNKMLQEQGNKLQKESENKDKENKDLKDQVKELQEKSENKEKENQQFQEKVKDLQEQSELTRKENKIVGEGIEKLKAKLKEKKQNLSVLQNQLMAKEKEVAVLQGELEARKGHVTDLQGKLKASNKHVTYLERHLTLSKGDVTGLEKKLSEKGQHCIDLQREVTERERSVDFQRKQLSERDEEVTELKEQLAQWAERDLQVTQQWSENNLQILELHSQVEESNQQIIHLQEKVEERDEQVAYLQRSIEEAEQRVRKKEATGNDGRVQEGETTPATADNYQRCDWAISRNEIHMTDTRLGVGAWGAVVLGRFRGCKVAVKQIHELIISPHNRRLFEREMSIALRCRHPCLLQFIGATNDEGSPLFVTELMESSLRALLEQQPLSCTDIFVIALDVAQALNYLHKSEPPIIHRDISSANVLLWRQGDQWRGKVSDYGTANFIQQSMTVGPGAVNYSSPEASTGHQTIKTDVYSFGVLLCEMCIRELPDSERREEQVARVTDHVFLGLIRCCIQREPEARPTMEEIIENLDPQ